MKHKFCFSGVFQNLGGFGPMKCREIYSLDKLKRQAVILDRLLCIAKEGTEVRDLHQGK